MDMDKKVVKMSNDKLVKYNSFFEKHKKMHFKEETKAKVRKEIDNRSSMYL
jgi:protein associated with RNAse G/E